MDLQKRMETSLKIKSATFGPQDVTEQISLQVMYRKILYIGTFVKIVEWLGDPTPGKEKILTIEYEWHGIPFVKNFGERHGHLIQPLCIGFPECSIEISSHITNPLFTTITRFKHGLEFQGPSIYCPLRFIYNLVESMDNIIPSSSSHGSESEYSLNNKKLGHYIIADTLPNEHVVSCSYDFIYAFHRLESDPNPLHTLLEWKNIIKPEGYIIIVIPWTLPSAYEKKTYPFTSWTEIIERSQHSIPLERPHVFHLDILFQMAQFANLTVVEAEVNLSTEILFVVRK